MPEDTNNSSFIPQSLRPAITLDDSAPPLDPATPASELRRRAEEAMGLGLLERLGLAGPAPRPEEVCARNPEVIWTAMDGEAVLLHLGSGYYYSLNHTGAAIWELLTVERDLAAIREAIHERFGAPPEAVWQDLAALVIHLRREKLVIGPQ